MVKKIFWVLVILLIIFVGLIYISVSGHKDFDTAVLLDFDDIENINFREHDSVHVATSTLYKGNFLKQKMQGKNYREAWATPVTIPVVFLDTLMGGMTFLKEGGGSQTHTLKLRSTNGTLYSLRSINKDPQSHIPDFAKTLGLGNIVVDGVSASHPYAAIAAAALAEVAGVLHTHPKAYFVPKQEFLGDLNEKYGNRLYLLEYETEGDVNWTPYDNVYNIIETDDLLELKLEIGSELSINKSALVRARLFDFLIGDWDRHAKQWGWVILKSGSGYSAVALPGDRDNAFFKIDGFIPSIITNKNVEPLVRPFEKEIDYLPGLVYPFDVFFLKGTPEEVYLEEAKRLQNFLSDANIRTAMQTAWPNSLFDLDGEEIISKIIHRRENLKEYAIAFRNIIEEREALTQPLKGSENLKLNPSQLKCFECLQENR